MDKNMNAETPTTGIAVTESAARRIGEIMAAECGNPGAGRLRIVVTGGGCSGFQFHFKIDEGPEEGDIEYERSDAKVVVDDISLQYIAGSELDFINNLEGAYFTLNNPNATSSCGCGTSFSI